MKKKEIKTEFFALDCERNARLCSWMAEVVDIGAWQWQMVGNEVRGRRENWELKEKEEEILDGVQEK